MKSFISEDDIEQTLCTRLIATRVRMEAYWVWPECGGTRRRSKTGRRNSSECILPKVFLSALERLNPQIDKSILAQVVADFRKDYTGTDMIDTNYRFYNQLRNGINVKVKKNGKDDFDIVRLIDFDNVENNDFHCVNQMWIKGRFRYRRPDVLLFVNGLPMVFIELKNSTVKIKEAYNKNLVSYREDIPTSLHWTRYAYSQMVCRRSWVHGSQDMNSSSTG